ncbi:hypothetical protein GL50803_00113165 [Giardia duodenalis]|uniref:Uncharacterized protein n=1 Tax=Giardia intestinalis (strain ATCC 50803 / WB clone C6) TaxID=184922 RepID=A8B729_GIAIC|nr:hypothetical protein GL50803_00113165 [Giardia intestinalis]KAE8301797.1 hypothetical protein GL50803_00113165 [Giardia intestinalis]|eukprot:XP_001709124.1 Hypothetical protein GL50803_113165 [Giardia lamblia ATCC 50803]
MLISIVLSIASACSMETPFTEEPSHGMGVRFTQRGLEKFCQKGYALIPDIISAMPSLQVPEVTVGPLKFTLSNVKPRAARVSTMKVHLQDNNFVKMEARDGLMQISMRLKAVITGITGTVDCIFTLKDFGADISLRLGDDSTCPYHFGLSEISNVVYSSGFDIDAIGLDTGGSVLATAIQGMAPTLEDLMKNTVLQSLLDTIFNSVKQSMLNLLTVVQIDDYLTDQRYINGINVVDNKIVADQGGFSMIITVPDWSVRALYPNKITSPPPKTVYTDRDYEFYVDRESVNSYLYAWHVAYDKFKADSLTVPYSTIRGQNIPGLAEALVKAGLLSTVNDLGLGVTLTLSISPSKDAAPHIPWIGAAALPVNLTGALSVTASKASTSASKLLVSAEGNVLFVSALKLRKFVYGFGLDQVYAHIEFLDVYEIAIIKNNVGSIHDFIPLLKFLLLNKYLPFANPILTETGIWRMNGNFISYDAISTIYLCNEDRVLFATDVEKNQYFA